MLRTAALVVMLILAQIGWGSDERYPLPPEVVEATVDSLAREYYDAKFSFYPARATLWGIPGHEGRSSTYSQRSMFGLLRRIRDLRRGLEFFDEDSLSMAKWVEYKALLADMATQRYLFENLEIHRRQPTIYVDACVEGIAGLYLLSNGDTTAPDLNPSLRSIPQVIRHARRNLTRPSKLHCLAASERLAGLIGFLSELRDQPFPNKDPELLQESIDALARFAAFIDSLDFTAQPGPPLAYDEFAVLLDTRNMISDGVEGIRTYAERVLEAVNRELNAYGDSSSPGRVEFSAGDLAAEVDSIRRSIKATDVVSLPDQPGGSDSGIRVLSLPERARGIFGDIVYFEPRLDDGASGSALLYVWSGISEPGITLEGLAASEVLPGRHLQALFASMNASPVCRAHHDIFAINGWSLYSQDLMAHQGFGGEEALRAYLERKRFYAAGAAVAIDMMLGDATLDQSAEFLARETGISGEYARQLALQYALEPEVPISYIIGERQIARLRDEMKRIKGEGFSLKGFHDSFLACGRLPVYLIRNNAVTGSVGRQ